MHIVEFFHDSLWGIWFNLREIIWFGKNKKQKTKQKKKQNKTKQKIYIEGTNMYIGKTLMDPYFSSHYEIKPWSKSFSSQQKWNYKSRTWKILFGVEN